MRGVVTLEIAPGAELAAPVTGARLGAGQGGPVVLRLFRLAGTRVALAARVLPAQLLAVRATAAGTPVQVMTPRPQLWEPLLRGAPQSRVVPDASSLAVSGGPMLVVDDRPPAARSALDARPWQCRVDVRTQWGASDLAHLALADVAVFGAMPGDAARAVASAFGLARDAVARLAQLDAGSFAVVRRGRVDFVSLDPTPAEAQVLDSARGVGHASSRPPSVPAGRR
ncbi:hypothetical protein GCM10027265_10990 [Jatrophihabitans fulvus]